MSELKLLPCPFCGGEAVLFGKEKVNWVSCRKCLADMKTSETKEQAIAAWNSRTGRDINVATNADRILGMSDEELAEFLATVKCRGAAAEACDAFWEDDSYSIDWLQQPAETEGTE